ncbi:DOCK-like protein YLR422W [Ceratocystis fimbriata CBS 114723]|uniref:DOCK-like protein YLR422W n=1 Tax=Ceratocystis fimbriata CBS 114723 TaxID=1035309 RepID=A0A2C5WRU6_9PEZI|nr:DOCK-like protein YLR422W [Ceratocystis fimbriata CBS 114723]
MLWQPLPRIAFAIATFPFQPSDPADLPLEIGDELYIIEETDDGNWLRGYLVAPPSLLSGLTSVKGQTLEARVFSGIFPRSCVEVRELLGEAEDLDDSQMHNSDDTNIEAPAIDTTPNQDCDSSRAPSRAATGSDSAKSGLASNSSSQRKNSNPKANSTVTTTTATTATITAQNPASVRSTIISPTTVLRQSFRSLPNGAVGKLSVPVQRDPKEPKPAAPVPLLKVGDETPTSISEPLIDEIASCLREWQSTNLHELLLAREYSRLDKLSTLVNSLSLSRQQYLHNVLTDSEYEALREKTVWDLVRVNKLCGNDVIVRDPDQRGRILTGDDSVVKITNLQAIMSLLDDPPKPVVELNSLHHLLVKVQGFVGVSAEDTTIELFLVSRAADGGASQVSECFSAAIPSGGLIDGMPGCNEMRTLFTDLSSQDIGDIPSATTDDLFLVAKVRSTQAIVSQKPSSRSGSTTQSSLRDLAKPLSSSSPGKQGMRRSLMWGSKSRSRSAVAPKLDPLNEQPESPRPPTTGNETYGAGHTRDASKPPSTAGSKSRSSMEGYHESTTMTTLVDRTIGMGILKLNSIMKQKDQPEVDHVMSIWSAAPPKSSHEKQDMSDYDDIVRHMMDSQSGTYEKGRRGERIQVSLQPFNHPDADVLIKSTPTVLSGVCKTNKMGFTNAPTKFRSDIYLTLDEAALSRQALLSRYGGNPTTLSGSIQGCNLQVTVEVRRDTGDRIDNCIYASSNSQGVSTWKSCAVQRGERWRQTIRLSVPASDVPKSHVVVFISDTPNPPFAVAYMPLWDRNVFRKDGPHSCLLYRVDEHTATPLPGPIGKGGYLSLPWSARGKDNQADVTGPQAMICLYTYLCSTKFSQDRVVLSLVKWKEASKEELPDLLKQLMFAPEIEVVKLLNDVLDALFSIPLEYNGNEEYEDLVFSALVKVLGIVHDRRFNLGPLVDQYAENRFSYPFATPCLMRSFTRLLENPSDPETARKLRSTFKVVRHLLKFITHDRGQQRAKEAHLGINNSSPSFTRQLRTIFKALDAMMRNTLPVLVGSQTLAVQHFHTWLPELSGLLSIEEIQHIAIDFMDSCSDVRGKLVLYKLVLIHNYANLAIFSSSEHKSILSANTVRWIAPHWGHTEDASDLWREQVRLCCSVLASQIDHINNETPDHIPKIIDSYLTIQAMPRGKKKSLSLLFPSVYPFPTRPLEKPIVFDEALMELSAILAALSNSPNGMQLEMADCELIVILENTLRVHMSILSGEAFPSNWLSVHIFHHKAIMSSLQYVGNILLESFLPEPDEAEDFNTELWKLFFATLLKLVGSPSLALETFPEQKRRAVWKIAGDVREHGATLLKRTWQAVGWETTQEEKQRYGVDKMGGYQVQYVPTLVSPIVELCLSVHQGLRATAVDVLQTMIVSEWTLSEDLSVIQTEIIDCLDRFFKDKPVADSVVYKRFVFELLDRFEPLSEGDEDEPLYAATRELMVTTDEFLDLLIAVHSSEDTSEASNLIKRLHLMEFLRDMHKEEIFVRYVHQLAALQAEARNFTEAGLALRLHADLYDWDPTRQVAKLDDPEFPVQTHFERKERIYFDMIKHFEEGEAWSSALAAYKELHVQYEENVYDFSKLARTQRAIAKIYETIAKSTRIVPKYFKVVYKGLGFPPTVRDKEYIYEGTASERASAFTDRMQEQFPSAQIVTGGDVDESEGQYLMISAVTPHRDLSHHVYQRARVPGVVRDYLVSSAPAAFSVSTRRQTSGPISEHYAEKTIYTTAEPFPTILRRSEIIATDELRLSAPEAGLERIVRKTQELVVLEKRVTESNGNDDEAVKLILETVTASVTATEQSVSCYRQLVPTASSDEDDDEDEDEKDELQLQPREAAIKMALVDHALILRKCLAMFSNSPNNLLSRHGDDLQRHFDSTYAPEINMFAPPPAPLRDLALPLMSSPWQRSSPTTESTNGLTLHTGGRSSVEGVSEINSVRPVSVRVGKGARLNFFSGRRKASDPAPMSPMSSNNGVIGHSFERARSGTPNDSKTPNFTGADDRNVPSSHRLGHHPHSASISHSLNGNPVMLGPASPVAADVSAKKNRRSFFYAGTGDFGLSSMASPSRSHEHNEQQSHVDSSNFNTSTSNGSLQNNNHAALGATASTSADSDWASKPRASEEHVIPFAGAGLVKMNSMRKRLSLLKIGSSKKPSMAAGVGTGMGGVSVGGSRRMGSVDEE